MDFEETSEQLNADLGAHSIFSSPVLVSRSESDVMWPGYKEELTTKRAVELLIAGTLKTKVCRYCLNIVSSLSELDQILQVAGTGALHKVTIRDMVASFYPFKCERSERALRNCFDDMYDKLDKLDPLERPKKRGRQKRNPNYNTIYAEHKRVIDYAEPMINIVNTKSVSLSKEPAMSDLECPKCWQLFTKIEDLMLHEKSHPSSMWFNCRLCGKSFVKRMHLKRHLKQTHMKPDMLPIQSRDDDKFECKICDLTSHDYSTHLQHMEKHKFQMVLEHLVEKDMDKLCTICLDKDPKLVDLDKMVRLHGGYPGATGDKTLYSILGSTLPDHKSYKYQELHVAHHAKIMKFAKLTQDKVLKKLNHSIEKKIEVNVNQIIISNPLIISNDKIDVDEMYLFFFSDASFYKELEAKEIIPVLASVEYKDDELNGLDSKEKKDMNEESEKAQNVNANVSPNTCAINTRQDINEKENDTDLFITKVQSVDDKDNKHNDTVYSILENEIENFNSKQTENEGKKMVKNIEICKTCWIFNKPTCNTCINKLVVTDTNEIAYTENQKQEEHNSRISRNIAKDDCKYCWLFKSCAKCDYCKRIVEDKTVTNSTRSEYVDKQSYNAKEPVDPNTEALRKRKLKNFETNTKLMKWDCDICLITNVVGRQICICCGSNKCDQNETVTVNWNFKNPFNLIPDNDADQYKVVAPCEEMDVESETNLQHTEESLETKNESYNLNIINEPENAVFTENTTRTVEKMDVADADDRENIHVAPNLYSLNVVPNNVVVNSLLQFNLGAGVPERKSNRRIAKPIRKMAYHK
ncbi:hypothetical protein MSG28_015813 [Choristoneura fumiferana]|uniref:Uncharacterized protein n=1 Tax=Choristoneura fumiferana TaxID=7141 RepID=A0ACC0KC81_CHOFU|nr:hypothetical protein MSG28_015813 [Choristoneura fumiferana]